MVRGASAANAWRADFPALEQRVHDRPLVYLDSASTTLKPHVVLRAVENMLARECANVHRGVHALSEAATASYEAARGKVARMIGAARAHEIVFTRGTTESINLVAQTLGRARVGPGDAVLVTELEHHSNLVPWQMLCRERGAQLRVLPIDESGQLRLDLLPTLLGERTRLVALSHASNVLGTVNPVAQVARLAHERGALVLVDGAQAVAHLPVDVKALDCDFYAFSAHKMYGPTGVGVLYGCEALLETMPPWQGGGDMVLEVRWEGTTYQQPPYRFEAGTPNIAGVVGLGAAVDYRDGIGLDALSAHERVLGERAMQALGELPGLRILGTAPGKLAIVSFVLGSIHPHDAGTVLDREGIAVRTGHHCAQPLMARFGVAGTVRASFALYNTAQEVDALARGLRRVIEAFA
ncbi:MAG TPA: cysteine desulfurase [Polyangia bacterium]|nr:cysteine desulfurase [Polyangia bacterium]